MKRNRQFPPAAFNSSMNRQRKRESGQRLRGDPGQIDSPREKLRNQGHALFFAMPKRYMRHSKGVPHAD
jgi:hypothetical protein